MAKGEKLLTARELALAHRQHQETWACAIANAIIDRADQSEFKLKADEKFAEKFPLFHETLLTHIAMNLSVAKKSTESNNKNKRNKL